MTNYEEALQQIEQLTGKVPAFPYTKITFDIGVKSVEKAEKIIEKICAAHDGKHKLNIKISCVGP